MATVGSASLILALGVAVFGIGASLYGARAHRPEWAAAGRRSVYAMILTQTCRKLSTNSVLSQV